ncbi:MAG: alpha-amylase family glycosyl hydrolase [Oscillospiraceae bacterium]
MDSWWKKSCFYQIYPLGFCGAPKTNLCESDETVSRIQKTVEWIPHLKQLGVDAVLFNPVADSGSHGYDTRNFGRIDPRLGTNDDFKQVCSALHTNGIRVVLDGVFNHVGREFWAFSDLRKNKQNSPYKDWFNISFDGNSNYNDGFWYEGWEGHYELVKLNLRNPEVIEHIFRNVRFWVEEFGIDGLRLDVAYCLDRDFVRALRRFCNELKPEFVLIGEVLFGDYNLIVNDEMLNSCTNYECYKGLFSSLNCNNLFELTYSLNRQFGNDAWCLYRSKQLMSFADNHDVSRLASILEDKRKIFAAYALLFSMPGIPCIYYGSEWGASGKKQDGDDALRPCFDAPVENELFSYISRLADIRKNSQALSLGGYRNIVEQNTFCLYERFFENEHVLCAVNISESAQTICSERLRGDAVELISGQSMNICGSVSLEPMQAEFFRLS